MGTVIQTDFILRGSEDAEAIKSKLLITSIRLSSGLGYDRITLWNRGACSGTLTVTLGDGYPIVQRLLGDAQWIVNASLGEGETQL